MRISDWSSDVCSSDLPGAYDFARAAWFRQIGAVGYAISAPEVLRIEDTAGWRDAGLMALSSLRQDISRRLAESAKGAGGAIALALMTGERGPRSEERRVGKEWVSTVGARWSPTH